MEHKRYQRIFAMLAVFAMLFCDLNVSSFAEGNTEAEEDRIRTICGLEEHTHTDECYEKTLVCGKSESGKKTEKRFSAFRVHEHNDGCYDEAGNLNCGIIEGKYYHAHNEYCYDKAGNLVCGLQEVWPHVHTDECYETEKKLICEKDEEESHTHTDACYKQNRELICEKAEDPGHHHTDACYTEHTNLTCGKQEDPGHHHSDACYTEHKELTCEKAEDPGHHHSDACYSEHTELTCGKQEDPGHHHGEECYRDQKVISCEQEENENHTHTEECYTILHELICEEPERDGHTHGESCYTTTRDLTCKETERDGHAHGDSCYTTLRKLTCGETERDGHTHGESCYTTTRDLTCKERERDGHTHTDSCYRVRNELVCKKKETAGHTHNESCYETQQNLICDELSTTHHHTAACRNEEGRLICGQVEVQEFVSTADRWTEEVISEEHRHTEDCYEQNLICEKVEHTHTDACYPEQEESEEPEDGSADEPPETLDGEQTEATGEASDNDGEGTGGENEEGTETKEDGETDTEDEAGEETGEENEEDTETEEDGETDSEEEAGKEAGEENEEDTEIKENEEDPDEKDSAEDAEEGDGEETDEEELTEEQGEITITAEDAPYAVSISFSGDAGIPEGTKLVVSEAGGENPAEEKSQTRFAKAAPMKSAGLRSAEAPQERHIDIPSMTVWNAGEAAPDIILYQKTLDISLVSEEGEIEPDPAALITVTVQLPGVEDGQAVEVRHITDGGTELLESTNDAGSITFTTSGFSLFEFTSRAQALSTWSTGQTANTFYGKTSNQEAQASAVSVSDVTEGLEVLEAYSLTRSSDLWVVLQRIADIALGKTESIALYTVEDGQLGAIVREHVSLSDVLRFNLGDLGGYALVRDTGLRHIIAELGNITLDGMMPKNSAAEATDVREKYSDPMDYEETVAAYDIAILSDGEEYQPGESPVKVSIRDDDITAALEEGKTVRLWHITDDGSREEIPYTLEEGTVSFEAAGFSAYVFSASIEKIITIDGENWKVTVEYGDDAGIPEDAELEIHEVEAGDYQAAATTAWNWTENNYIFYTKFLDISIVRDGETIEPLAPVSVTIQLQDVEAGAEALRVVHFGKDGAEAIDGQAGADGTIQFEADAFSVFGFGNALQPLTSTETEEADLTIYGFGGEARLTEAAAPEVEEGLEVLGAYTLSSEESSKAENGEEGIPKGTVTEGTTREETSEEGITEEEIPAEGNPGTAADGEPAEETTEAAAGTGNSNNNLWIKAELKDGTELSETESVVLCAVSGEKTDSRICELTTSGQIMKLEKENLAIIKDTGYRHLNFVLDPNGENQKPAEQKNYSDEEEHAEEITEAAGNDESEESTEDNTGDVNEENRSGDEENAEDTAEGSISGSRIVILDGMMPKNAEATAIDVTETFTEHEYPAPKDEKAEETTEEAQEEPEENKPEAEQTEEGDGEEAAEEKTETRRNTLAAYEITILNNETEYQPDAGRPIQVEIRDSRITTDGYIELWHIRDDGAEEQVTEFAADKGKITFAATGFSAYAIVELLDPASLDDEDVENLEELALNWNVPEKGGRGFYLSYNNKSKFISNSVAVSNKGDSVLVEVSRAELNDNCIWYFEKQDGTNTTESNKYYIYTKADETKKYIHQISANDNNIELSSDPNLKTAFDLSEAASKFFYLKHEDENRWLQHSNGGGGIRLYTDNKNATNSRITFTYAASAAPEGDPLGLNDKTYGLMFWNGNITGKAMMAESTNANSLDAKAMEVLVKTGDNTDKIFVPNDSDISMWTFEWTEGNTYKISTKKNGAKMYLNVGENGGLSLGSDSATASLIQVETGTASHKGQIILKSNNQIIKYSGKVESGFGASRTGGIAGNEWLYLVDYSELTSDYLITYTASKISVSDPEITNDSKIIIYTRYWNDDDKCYDFYAINSDGTIQRCYESGDTIRWVGTRINTLLWDFIEYYYEDSTEPNYYYDLYNQYSQQYLRPQLDGGEALSSEKIGINLDGRKRGAYYSPIIAWDDSAYAFAGLKVDKGTGKVVPCPMDEAEDFYFAIMQKNDVDDDTNLVATVDNKTHGIKMKIANYDRVTNEGGQSTSQEQLGVLGFSKFDSGHPTAVQGGILSTDIKGNGYPEATATGRSLADLFSGATEVNHLFIQGTYNGSGYYTYDSTKNYATLRKEDGTLGTDFRVYREIGTNDAKSQPSMQHGQFTPFNDIEPGVFSERNPENLYTATLHELPETDPRKHEKLYLVRNPDLYFGVELEASFVQTPSGKDAWDHDIIYQFTGDDDFWLYVDGELVIDLGGIHSAVGGSVNYHTGEVVVNGRHTTLYQLFYENYLGRGHTEAEAQSYVDGLFTTNGDNKVFKDYTTHTMRIFYMERGGGASNLNMRFNLASVKPGHVELSKKIDGVDNKESLMAEFPYQIFYRKQSMEAAPDETEKLLAEDGNPVNIKVHYKGTNTPVKYAREYTVGGVTYDSVFLLKPGEAADIEIPDEAIYYRIVECGVNTDVYHKKTTPEGETEQDITVTVNEGKETVKNSQIYATSQNYLINGEKKTTTVQTYPDNRKDYSIGYARTGDRSRAAFVNSVDPAAMRTLTIEKQLFDVSGNPVTYENDRTTFGFRLSLSSENEDEPALVDKYIYHIIDRNGVYCKWDTASQTFVPLGEGKTVYADLSPEEQKLVRFTTSMNGSISKIPVSYRVEIRGLPIGTKYKVEERKNEIPDGYSLRDYDIYENADDESTLTSYYPSELPKKTIEKNKDPKVVINNLKGFGLRVYKEWNDEDYMEYRDPIYLAVYKDNGSGPVLAEGTVRELKQKNNTMYWYFKALGEGYDFDDYVVREVALTNPTLDPETEGVVANYDSITPIDEGGTATISGRQKGESTASALEYTVHYDQGVPELDKPNIREDHIFNTRKGLVIRKEDWEGNGLENTTFILKDTAYTSGSNLLNASYTSLASGDVGYVTTAFLRKGATYTLTETKTKTGYLGLQAPLTINVDNNGNIAVSSTSSADEEFFILSDENGIKTLTVKNKPFTFTVAKIDKGTGTPLRGARFELHKQITVGGVTMFDFNPLPGYTSDIMITGEDGVLPGLNQTLPAGTYRLDETYAPTGYVKWSTGLIFTVNDVGKITLGSRYPDGTVLTGTPQEIDNRVFYEYKLNIPNSEDSKWPYLQVTKKVTGRTADPTKKFRFTITLPNVDPGAKYDYTLGDETGTVTVDAKHQIIKYLKHGQTLEIARLPLNTSVSVAEETGIYTTDWKKDGTAATATDNAISFNLADSTEIEVTNDMKPVAPTGFTTRHKPYFLLMLFGFMLLTAIAGIGWIQKRRTADGEDDPPDPGDHPKNSNSPPGGRKHFASGGRTNRRSGIRTAEESGYDRKEFPERSYHKMMKLKKISALALAILMITMTGLAFADVSMTDENGVIGEFETPDTATTQGGTVVIYKEITALNPEPCTVNAPAITYNYTIGASDSLAGKTVTDASSHHNKINDQDVNVSVTTKKGVGAPTITGTGNGVLALVPGTDTLDAAPTGKANRFALTVDFSKVNFLTDGTGAGVYRYQIDETTTPANRNAAGITDGTVANTLYLDVYVDGSGSIYGYVLFTTNGEINASPDADTAAASAAGKTEGFVGGKADGQEYDADNSAADKYYTFNLAVAKTVSGDNYVVTHKNKFPFTVTLANNTVTQNVLPFMTIDNTELAAQTALTAAPIAGTWTPQIASGGMITYVGIPCGTTVTIKEKNNVSNTIYNSVSAGADTNAAGKAIAYDVESNNAQVTCGQTALKAATENHTDAKQVKFTNTLLQISPTGIVLRVAPYLLMLAAGIALVVILVAKRRKHTDED